MEEILLKMEERFSGESPQLCINVIFNNMAAAVDRLMENTNSSVIKLALSGECFQGYCRTELKRIMDGGDAFPLGYGDRS